MPRPSHAAIRFWAIALSLAGLCAAGGRAALADVVTLKDGTTYQGRIVERTAGEVVLQVDESGISAVMRFETKDIAKVTESPPSVAQDDALYDSMLAEAEESGTAFAFANLGAWLQRNKLYDKAILAYERGIQLDSQREAELGLAIAQCLAAANNLRGAEDRLRQLATTYPAETQVAAELARIDQLARKRVEQMIRIALDNYRKADMRGTVMLLERVQTLNVSDVTAKADYAVTHQAGLSLARLLAEARLHQACPACGQELQLGLVPCPICKGSGHVTKTRLETVTEKDTKTGIERRRVRQVDYEDICPTCHGFGSTICPACQGAGVDLGTVGPLERAEVLDGLARRIHQSFAKLEAYLAEPSSLHPANLEVVHLHALRLQYYVQQYSQLRPDLAGEPLVTLAGRRTRLANLIRHTSGAYRNRDLKDYQAILAARLKILIERDGLLWPEDFEYQQPNDVSRAPRTGAPTAP